MSTILHTKQVKDIILLHPTKTAGTSVKSALEAESNGHLLPESFGNLNDSIVVLTIRNPYTRVMSMYNHFGHTIVDSFSEFLKLIQEDNPLFYPQNKYLVNSVNIIRFESLGQDFKKFIEKYNIKASLKKENVTKKVLKKFLTTSEKEIIYNRYIEDFKIFNYNK